MKKRITVLLLSAVMVFLLSGCQSKSLETSEISESDVSFSESSKESVSSQASEDSAETVEATPEIAAPSTDAEESDTSIPASPASDSESSEPIATVQPQESKTPETTKPAQTPVTTPEPTEKPKPTQEPTPQPTEQPKPQPTEQPTPEPEPKSIYDARFDVEAIRSELIAVGEGIGLTHSSDRTPSNASWSSPVVASSSYQGTQLERGLKDYVRSMPEMVAAYGGQTIEYFTIYVEPLGGGSYQFYFLY